MRPGLMRRAALGGGTIFASAANVEALTLAGLALLSGYCVRRSRRGKIWREVTLMEMEIGNAAGVIWRYLNEHGETTLTKLKQGTRLSDQLLLMGVGWLAKEAKVSFLGRGRTLKIGLKET